jgi:hypothetical protein
MELIRNKIEIQGEENTFAVYFSPKTNSFFAVENIVNKRKTLVFTLVDTLENIIEKHREEILEYCLGSFTKDDVVILGDIFLHGKYIKREHSITTEFVSRFILEEIEHNVSMHQIREHLEKLEENGGWIELSLRPPIGSKIIEDEGNRMYINEGRLGKFENVSEKFYDEMVVLFDSRYKERY